jgi:hypothetical protein
MKRLFWMGEGSIYAVALTFARVGFADPVAHLFIRARAFFMWGERFMPTASLRTTNFAFQNKEHSKGGQKRTKAASKHPRQTSSQTCSSSVRGSQATGTWQIRGVQRTCVVAIRNQRQLSCIEAPGKHHQRYRLNCLEQMLKSLVSERMVSLQKRNMLQPKSTKKQKQLKINLKWKVTDKRDAREFMEAERAKLQGIEAPKKKRIRKRN